MDDETPARCHKCITLEHTGPSTGYMNRLKHQPLIYFKSLQVKKSGEINILVCDIHSR